MKSLFVDTSVWYSAADSADKSNLQAKEILSSEQGNLITSDHVLLETSLLIRIRLGKNQARTFWQSLRDGVARLEVTQTSDLEGAWNIGQTFLDQDFSIADRTSFALMTRLGINRAASFDRDFSLFRYGPGKKKAFEVLSA